MLLPDRDERRNALHGSVRAGAEPLHLTRRTALAAGAAALFAPSIARASTATRRYRLERGSSDIGHHDISVSRTGGEIAVEIDIEILVRVLGIAAYRYTMTNSERWRGGEVVSIRSRTNNDGEDAFVTATRTGDVLEVEGSTFSGAVPGLIGTTTYWTPAFLQRDVWVSTQGGAPLDIAARRAGTAQYPTPAGAVPTTAWELGPELEATLHYSNAGEWVGSTFDARGQQVRYIPQDLNPALAPLWST